ncbi:hypothetical protein G7Y79_00034g069170 [Physcia stellaris]|nr:hypothetical protein G7Y79_00034g069170 [Physcia stellaris]
MSITIRLAVLAAFQAIYLPYERAATFSLRRLSEHNSAVLALSARGHGAEVDETTVGANHEGPKLTRDVPLPSDEGTQRLKLRESLQTTLLGVQLVGVSVGATLETVEVEKVVGTEEAEGDESKVVVVVEAVVRVLKNVVVVVVLVLSEDSLGGGAIPNVSVAVEDSEITLPENVLTGPVGVTSGTVMLVVDAGAELESEEADEEASEMTDESEERTDEELDAAEELDRDEATEETDEDTDDAELAAEERLLTDGAGTAPNGREDTEEDCERTDEELEAADELDREEATDETDEDTDEAELAAEDKLLESLVPWHEARGVKAAAARMKVLEYMMVVFADRGRKMIANVKFAFDDEEELLVYMLAGQET